MSDKVQVPANSLLPVETMETPQNAAADAVDDGELTRQELARITPSNDELLKIAAQCGPLPKWLDEDEPLPS